MTATAESSTCQRRGRGSAVLRPSRGRVVSATRGLLDRLGVELGLGNPAARLETEPPRSQDAADHDEQRHGFVLEEDLPEHEDRERRSSDGERRWIGLVQVLQERTAVLPEVSVRAVDAEALNVRQV